MEYQMDD